MTPDPCSIKLHAYPVQLIKIPDGIIIKRGGTELRIRGDSAAKVVETVFEATGGHGATLAEIRDRVAPSEHPFLKSLLERLLQERMLAPTPPSGGEINSHESSLDIFYWHFGESAAHVTEHLNSRRLAILGVNAISRQLAAALVASGWRNFQVVDAPLLRNLRFFDQAGRLVPALWPSEPTAPLDYQAWQNNTASPQWDCLIATSDFGAQESMRAWNRFCVERHRPFLPVVLQNVIGYVGPLVLPGETACFECLRARQNAHLADPDAQRAAEAVAFEGQSVVGFHPSMASILGDLAAFELTKFYSGVLPLRNVGILIEVNLLATGIRLRKVLKVPRCPVCSPLTTRPSTTPDNTGFAVSEKNP